MHVEPARGLPPPEHLLHVEVQTARRRVELTIQGQIEGQGPAGRLSQPEEDRVPRKPPGAGRIGVEGQAVVEESKADGAVLAADGIVEGLVLVTDPCQSLDGGSEQFEFAAAPFVGAHDAKLPQAVVGCGEEVCVGFRLPKGQRQEAPEIEFVMG